MTEITYLVNRISTQEPTSNLSFKGYSGYILRELRYLFRKSLLFFAEALGARTGCGKISDGADSERGRNRRISGGLPEGREKLISAD